MENKFFHITVAVALIVLLALLIDPFMYWMPTGMHMIVLLGATAMAALWSGFVVYERAHDEREVALTMHAGRIAYLSGIAVLTIALVVQGIQYTIDPWIPLALGVMVVAKITARLLAERR